MNRFDDLIARATAKLSMDGELKLEIGRELRGHLEDSAAEYEAGGYAPERAVEEAVKHLGDAGELAEELWKANRGRLRVRAVVKRVISLMLIPLAFLVLALQSPWNPAESWRQIQRWAGGDPGYPAWFTGGYDSGLASLTEEQRFIWFGDPAAQSPLEAAKSVADRWPDNPVYYGYYTALLLQPFHDQVNDQAYIQGLLDAVNLGNRIEPENGMYDLIRALALLGQSSELSDDPARGYTVDGRDGQEQHIAIQRIRVTDPALFEQGMASFRKGIIKPRITDHVHDMVVQKLNMLPPPRSYLDYIHRTNETVNMILPTLGPYRRMARIVAAHAVEQADHGHATEANQDLGGIEAVGIRIAAEADVVLPILVGHSIALLAEGHKLEAARSGGDPQAAARAEQLLKRLASMAKQVWSKDSSSSEGGSDPRTLGLIGGIIEPGLPGYRPTMDPSRDAERVMMQRGALQMVLAATFWALVGGAGAGLWMRRRARKRGQETPMLFVGWRRLLRVTLVGLALPLAVYFAYASSPLANRQFAMLYMAERWVIEAALLSFSIMYLLSKETERAVTQRVIETGLAPQAISSRHPWVGRVVIGFLAAATVVYVGAWQFESLRPTAGLWEVIWGTETARRPFWQVGGLRVAGLVLLVLIIGLFLGWMLTGLWRLRKRHKRDRAVAMVCARSSLPVLTGAMIVLTLLGKWSLARTETDVFRQIRTATDLPMFQEVERSNLRLMREFYRQWQAEGRMPTREGAEVPPGGAGG